MQYRRGANIIDAMVRDELVALDTERGMYHHLNPTGAAIWQALETPRSFEALVSELRTRFPDGGDAIAPETRAFLDQLIAQGIVLSTDAAE